MADQPMLPDLGLLELVKQQNSGNAWGIRSGDYMNGSVWKRFHVVLVHEVCVAHSGARRKHRVKSPFLLQKTQNTPNNLVLMLVI